MAAPYAWQDRLIDIGWLRVLKPSELNVLLALGKFMNSRTREAWPSLEKLQRLTGLSRSAIYGALKALAQYGLMQSEIAVRRGRYREYRVELHRLVAKIPAPPVQSNVLDDTSQGDGVQSSGLDSQTGRESHEAPTATRESGEHLASSRKDIREGISTELDSSFHPSGTGNGQLSGLRKLKGFLADLKGGLSDTVRVQLVAAGERDGWTPEDIDREWAVQERPQ
jgi:biotin operon repressor